MSIPMSFPQSVERESRAFFKGTGFRFKPVLAGSKQGTSRNDTFEGISGHDKNSMRLRTLLQQISKTHQVRELLHPRFGDYQKAFVDISQYKE